MSNVRRWVGLAALFALFACMRGLANPQPAIVESAVAAGMEAYQRYDFARAIALWEPLLPQLRTRTSDNTGTGVMYYLGRSYAEVGEPAKALDVLQQCATLARMRRDRFAEAAALGSAGVVSVKLERFNEALALHRRALAIHKAIGEKLGQALDFGNIGDIDERLGRYQEALSAHREALKLDRALRNHTREAGDLNNIGLAQFDLGQYDDALASHRQALAIDRAVRNPEGEANDLGNIGRISLQRGNAEEALAYHERARAIDHKIGNLHGESLDYGNLGATQYVLGRYDDALKSNGRALAIANQLGDRRTAAAALGSIGHIEQLRGNFDEAFARYRQSLAINRELQDRRGIAVTLHDIGTLELDQQHLDKADAALREALAIDRAIRNAQGEAGDLTNLAIVDEDRGLADAAFEEYRQAYAIQHRIGDAANEARTLIGIGNFEGRRRRFLEALAAYGQARAIEDKLTDRALRAEIDAGFVDFALALARYDVALTASRRAADRFHEIGDARNEAASLVEVAAAEMLQAHYADALRDVGQAAALERKLANPRSAWRSSAVAAFAEQQLGRRDEAVADYGRAIDRLEVVRAGYGTADDRAAFLAGRIPVYDLYVAYLRELDGRYPNQGYDRLALQVFERKQARALLEELARSNIVRFREIPDDIVARDRTTQSALEAARKQVDAVSDRSRPDAAALADARSAVDRATAARTAFEAELRARYPAYEALLHPRPVTPDTLQKDVLAPGEVMLAYDVYDKLADASVLWVVDREHLRMVTLPGKAELRKAVDAVRERVGRIQTDVTEHALASVIERDAATDLPLVAAASHALFRALVPDSVVPAVTGARSVVVVPSGPLFDVPWEALETRGAPNAPHYLIEDVPISYVPSGSLLALVRNAERGQRRSPQTLLALAAPTYAAPGAAAPAYPNLPNAAREAEEVRAIVGAPADSVLTGDAASRQAVLDLDHAHRLSDRRYVLFAVHAELPDAVRGRSQPAIILAHPERGDGRLTMADIFGLSLNADFVVLSACDTGAGPHDVGEGVSGLTRAFMYAGTPAISVTLWSIDDAAAPRIVPEFFRGLNGGQSAAAALRAAKVALIRGESARFRHPFSWAPTVIFGDAAVVQRT